MVVELLAFGLGVLLVWIGFRAVGWLLVVGLVCVGSVNAATQTITVHNYSSASMGISASYDGQQVGYVNNGQTIGPGGDAVFNVGWCGLNGGVSYIGTLCLGVGHTVWVQLTSFNNCAGNLSFGAASCETNNNYTPPPVYYNNGCLTNSTMYPKHVFLSFNGSPPVPDPMDRMLLPGEGFCWTVTNGNWFTTTATIDTYDGEGHFLDQRIGGPYDPTGTNSAGSPIQVPFPKAPGGDGGGTAGGAGSTNTLTGREFNTGVTNLAGGLNEGFQFIGKSIGNLGGTLGFLTNLAGNNPVNGTNLSIDLSNLLAAVKNVGTNTLVATNDLSQVITNTGGKMTNSFADYLAGGGIGVLSNAAFSDGSILSNTWYQAETTNGVAGAMAQLEIAAPQTGDQDIWKVPWFFKGTSGGTNHTQVDLNPRNLSIWDFLPWVKIVFTWLVAFIGVNYIKWRLRDVFETIVLVPGAGPGKGTFSFLTAGVSKVLFATLALYLPVIVGAAIASVTSGLSLGAGPLSTSSVAAAGIWATAIREAIAVVQYVFPLAYFLSMVAYLWFFDVFVTGFVVWGCSVLRAVSN